MTSCCNGINKTYCWAANVIFSIVCITIFLEQDWDFPRRVQTINWGLGTARIEPRTTGYTEWTLPLSLTATPCPLKRTILKGRWRLLSNFRINILSGFVFLTFLIEINGPGSVAEAQTRRMKWLSLHPTHVWTLLPPPPSTPLKWERNTSGIKNSRVLITPPLPRPPCCDWDRSSGGY